MSQEPEVIKLFKIKGQKVEIVANRAFASYDVKLDGEIINEEELTELPSEAQVIEMVQAFTGEVVDE